MTISVTNIGVNYDVTGSINTISITVGAGGVPAGSLIVVGVYEHNEGGASGIGTLTDSHPNSYTAVSFALASGYAAIFYSYNSFALSNGNTITYTLNVGMSNEVAISAFYATGISAVSDPIDASVTKTLSTTSASPTLTSGVPSVSGELFTAFICSWGSTTQWTQDTGNGWAAPFNPTGNAGFSILFLGGSQVNSGVGTITYAPTRSGALQCGLIITGFKGVAVVTLDNSSQMLPSFSRTSIIGY